MSACRHRICHPEGPCNCPDPHGGPNLRGLRPLADDILVSALWSMRTLLKPVPQDYFQVGPTRVTVACACRRGLRFRSTGFVECPCGRALVWTGRNLYALKPEVAA